MHFNFIFLELLFAINYWQITHKSEQCFKVDAAIRIRNRNITFVATWQSA